METDSMASSSPSSTMSQQRRAFRKSMTRLLGTPTLPTDEAQRAHLLCDGCVIPSDLDRVRPDCLSPIDVVGLYVEASKQQTPKSRSLSPSQPVPTKTTVYLRINNAAFTVSESHSLEIDISVFDQDEQRFVTDHIIFNADKGGSISDWIEFADVPVTPTSLFVFRFFVNGDLVEKSKSIRDCRRQLGISTLPMSSTVSEAGLRMHPLLVLKAQSDRYYSKLLATSTVKGRARKSMSLTVQTTNMLPVGIPSLPISSRLSPIAPGTPTLIQLELIAGQFHNMFKTSTMNVCVEAYIVVRGNPVSLRCLRRGSEPLSSVFTSCIVYHCDCPKFDDTFMIDIDVIRREVPDSDVALNIRAFHVTRSGTLRTIGYAMLVVIEPGTGRIATTKDRTVLVPLLDIVDHSRSRNMITLRSTIRSDHDTDDETLANVLGGRATMRDLKVAHERVQRTDYLDQLLLSTLIKEYLSKSTHSNQTLMNAAWSLYCILRKRQIDLKIACQPVQAEIVIRNLIVCFQMRLTDLVHLTFEVTDDPQSIIVTELSKSMAPLLVDAACADAAVLTGKSFVLILKVLANLMDPDQVRSASDRLLQKVHQADDIDYLLDKMDRTTSSASVDIVIRHAVRYATGSNDACRRLSRTLSTMLSSTVSGDISTDLASLLPRLYNMLNAPQFSSSVNDAHPAVTIMQIIRYLHSRDTKIKTEDAAPHLAYVTRIANNTSFDPSSIVLRVMELHCATLILDMLHGSTKQPLSMHKAILTLLNGNDVQHHGVRKRRGAYISLHIGQWLRPRILAMLKRYDTASPDLSCLELLFRAMMREEDPSPELQSLFDSWKSMANPTVFKQALIDELLLVVKQADHVWMYENAIKFLRRQTSYREFASLAKCLQAMLQAAILTSSDLAIVEDRMAEALNEALESVRRLPETVPLRLNVFDKMIHLHTSLQQGGPELAQCLLERGETQNTADPGRLSDFQQALQISMNCYEWEKAAMLCDRIIFGYSGPGGPGSDPNFVINYRKTRATLFRRIQTEDRVLPQYAHVAFNYCELHQPVDRGREYAYRLTMGESVLDFTVRLRKQYPYAEIINNFAIIAQDSQQPIIAIQRLEIYVEQKLQVEPDFAEDLDFDSAALPVLFRSSAFHSDVTSFVYSTKVATGEVSPSVADLPEVARQWYEIHRLQVKNKFPFLARRQEIISHKISRQSPIQTAISTVQQGTQKLQHEMERIRFAANQNKNVSIAGLSLLLAGIIDAPVNGGLPIYRTAFLCPNQLESKECQDLRNSIKKQKQTLEKGLEVFKEFAGPELRPLYQHLMKQMQTIDAGP